MSASDFYNLSRRLQALSLPRLDTTFLDSLAGGASLRWFRQQHETIERALRPLGSLDAHAASLNWLQDRFKPLGQQQGLAQYIEASQALPKGLEASIAAYRASQQLSQLSPLMFTRTYRHLAETASLQEGYAGLAELARVLANSAPPLELPEEAVSAAIVPANELAGDEGVQPSAEQISVVVAAVLQQYSARRKWTAQEIVMLILAVVQVLQFFAGPFWSKAAEKWLSSPALGSSLPQLEAIRIDRRRVTRAMKIRLNAKFNSPEIGTADLGEVVIVVKVEGSWTMIEAANQKGRPIVGWVFSRYLE